MRHGNNDKQPLWHGNLSDQQRSEYPKAFDSDDEDSFQHKDQSTDNDEALPNHDYTRFDSDDEDEDSIEQKLDQSTDSYYVFQQSYRAALEDYKWLGGQQQPTNILLKYDKLIDYAMQEFWHKAIGDFRATNLSYIINQMINGYTENLLGTISEVLPVDFDTWNPKPTEQQLNAMRYIAQKTAEVYTIYNEDKALDSEESQLDSDESHAENDEILDGDNKRRAMILAQNIYVPYYLYQKNQGKQPPGHYSPTHELNAAISELLNIAANPDIKFSPSIGPTQCLALIEDKGAEYRILKDAATKLSAQGITSQQRRKIALEALAKLFPKEAALTKPSYRATSAVTEMRNKRAEIAALEQENEDNRESVLLSKFDAISYNLEAQATIIAEKIEQHDPKFFGDDENKQAFISYLSITMRDELLKNPEDLLQEMAHKKDKSVIVASWSEPLQNRINESFGKDFFATLFKKQMESSTDFIIPGIIDVIYKINAELIAHEHYLINHYNSAENPTKNGRPYKNYNLAETIKAMDVILDCAIEAKRAIIELCKSRLQTGNFSKEEKAEFAIRIKEHEIALATSQFLLEGKNTQILLAASICGTLGGMAGMILGAGATAGITAAVSETAREALRELIKGSPEKFLEGLAAGNPVLVMTILSSIIGITGFAIGAFLAGETGVGNHVIGDTQERFAAFALIQLAELSLLEKQQIEIASLGQ